MKIDSFSNSWLIPYRKRHPNNNEVEQHDSVNRVISHFFFPCCSVPPGVLIQYPLQDHLSIRFKSIDNFHKQV
jgi:hypothetical protein